MTPPPSHRREVAEEPGDLREEDCVSESVRESAYLQTFQDQRTIRQFLRMSQEFVHKSFISRSGFVK